MEWRRVRTSLEDTLSSDALALRAEADTAEDGSISQFKDSVYKVTAVLHRGGSNGGGREAVVVVSSGTSEDGPYDVRLQSGVGLSHFGQKNGLKLRSSSVV